MIKNALLLCIVLAGVFFLYLPSYVAMQRLHEKNQVYQKKITDLERSNTKLAGERKRLLEDPQYFEKVAREKMGIIKDDEVIYKVVPYGHKTETSANTDGLIKE